MTLEEHQRRLGAAAKKRRLMIDMTAAEVAEKIGCAPSTIWRFERGDTYPRDPEAFVDRYAEAVGTNSRVIWKDAHSPIDGDRFMPPSMRLPEPMNGPGGPEIGLPELSKPPGIPLLPLWVHALILGGGIAVLVALFVLLN